jgi:hypothetical protein
MKRLEEKNVALKDDIAVEIIARIARSTTPSLTRSHPRREDRQHDHRQRRQQDGDPSRRAVRCSARTTDIGGQVAKRDISERVHPKAPDRTCRSSRASFALLMRRQRELNAKLDAIQAQLKGTQA